MFPFAAQEGYHVSAPVYFLCFPVKPMPEITAEFGKGQLAGGCEGQILSACGRSSPMGICSSWEVEIGPNKHRAAEARPVKKKVESLILSPSIGWDPFL